MENKAKISQNLIKFVANFRLDNKNSIEYLQKCIADVPEQLSEYQRNQHFLKCLDDKQMLKFFEKSYKNYYTENEKQQNPISYNKYLGKFLTNMVSECGNTPMSDKGTFYVLKPNNKCITKSFLNYIGEEKTEIEEKTYEKPQTTNEKQLTTNDKPKTSNKKRIIGFIIFCIILVLAYLGIKYFKNKKQISNE